MYYYGARYYDPVLSRWISTDPPLSTGEYLPVPPVNDQARERNENLPGMGGVFNPINLDAYQYAGQNPVRYVDPDGNQFNDPLGSSGGSLGNTMDVFGLIVDGMSFYNSLYNIQKFNSAVDRVVAGKTIQAIAAAVEGGSYDRSQILNSVANMEVGERFLPNPNYRPGDRNSKNTLFIYAKQAKIKIGSIMNNNSDTRTMVNDILDAFERGPDAVDTLYDSFKGERLGISDSNLDRMYKSDYNQLRGLSVDSLPYADPRDL